MNEHIIEIDCFFIGDSVGSINEHIIEVDCRFIGDSVASIMQEAVDQPNLGVSHLLLFLLLLDLEIWWLY